MKTMQECKVVNVLPPEAIKDDGDWTTTEIDTAGFGWCSIYLNLGETDVAMDLFKVRETDTSGSGYADITGADFSVSPATLPSATADDLVFAVHIDLRKNRKRYLSLSAGNANGTAGGFAASMAFLYDATQTPNSVAERGTSQDLFV